jgi:aldehyde:ferredoxin oxidoreductase
MDLMLEEVYHLRGLNETGVPRAAVLKALGLNSLANLLYPEMNHGH